MAFDYNETADAALTALQEFGLVTTIRRFLPTNFDPVEGTNTPLTYNQTAATAIALPSSDSIAKFNEVFKANLAAGRAKVFLIAAKGLTFEPKVGDCIVWENNLWEIGSGDGKGGLMALKPARVAVLFTAGCMESGRDLSEGSEA
jgi:hypothetical protein